MFLNGRVTKYHRSKMACCIIRVSSSSSASMHKVTTNVQRASLGSLFGVTGNDGFEREGSQNVVWTRRQYQIMFCKPCENKIWCFHSPLQQWLHGPEYSMRDLHYLSLNSATYNSWAWLQNNRQFRPTKKTAPHAAEIHSHYAGSAKGSLFTPMTPGTPAHVNIYKNNYLHCCEHAAVSLWT